MKSHGVRWLIALTATMLTWGAAGADAADPARTAAVKAADHERAHAPSRQFSSTCPEQARPAPKRPAEERAPKRVRPPSSLPCCKGADCTCSGPPALAAVPAPAARIAGLVRHRGITPRRAPAT